VRVLFIDEAGCPGALPVNNTTVQPLLCISGLVVDQTRLGMLTREWIDLKRRFYPRLCAKHAPPWDWQRAEVKGAELRAMARSSSRRQRRFASGVLDAALSLLESHGCSVVGRVWIKVPGGQFNGRSIYTFSVQQLCQEFQFELARLNEQGLVVADSRRSDQNSTVSHSIFTQKYQRAGDPYPGLVEVPLFGHSDNHAGIQIADLVASAILFPIWGFFFLHGKINSIHVHQRYEALANRFCTQLRSLELRHGPPHKRKGGIITSDKLTKRGTGALFKKYCNSH